jgi:hypothetical protein
MGQVLHIDRHRCSGLTRVHFARHELCRLLTLYSQRVATGEWRDYAIDQLPGRAVFAVFRHALDRPLFTISKLAESSGWEVASGPRKLCRADTIEEALAMFDRTLRLL